MTASPSPDDQQPGLDPPASPYSRHGAPAPLVAAASLTAIEGLLLGMYGVAEAFAVQGSRLTMGVTTALFFVVYAAALLVCAWGLNRRASWARSPVVLAQLIQLGVAWSYHGGSTTPVALALAVLAVLILVGVLHPASIRAIEHD